jgi:hypothetical protein
MNEKAKGVSRVSVVGGVSSYVIERFSTRWAYFKPRALMMIALCRVLGIATRHIQFQQKDEVLVIGKI